MNAEQILEIEHEKLTLFDKETYFILSSISKLHDKKIERGDLKEIKLAVSKVWRKYNPLDKLSVVEMGDSE